MNKNTGFIFVISLITLLLAACANNPLSSYKNTSDERLAKIDNGQLTSAIEAKNTPDVLYNMEYGLLLRLSQQYDPSNIYFGRAQEVMAIWANSWASTTSGQLGRSAASLMINDNVTDYQPRGYEKSFLATFYALNQIGLNNFDNARVEIKQMYELEQATQNYNQARYNQQVIESQKDAKNKTSNYLHQEIMKKYDFSDINSPKVLALKNSYQNAFSHYLAGFVFEALNEPSLARPGYVKAGQLNPTNPLIQKSIDNLDNNVVPKPGYTDLLLVEEVGHAAQIQSMQIPIHINLNLVGSQSGCLNTINIFYPKLVLDKNNQAVYNYQLDNHQMAPLPMVDVDLMTARALADETPHIISRNIAAALRNIATAQASCAEAQKNQQLGGFLSILSSFGGQLLDRADERTLTLLPNKININRVSLPYGKHTIAVQVDGASYTQPIILNQSYQVLTFRIIGNQVFFDPQQSMVKQ